MASVLDIIKHYQRDIEKHSDDEAKVLRCIDKLFQLSVTVQHLQETGVGRTVNALRKEPGEVGQAARALVLKWKTMVAAEESDQEGDHRNDTSAYNGHGSGRESDDHSQHSRNNQDRYSSKNSTPKSEQKEQHKEMNGHHSGSKRKYQSSEEEDHDTKKARARHSSSSEDDRKKPVFIKKEKLTDSESTDDDSQSSDSDSDSYTSESSKEDVKVKIKQEIKQEIKKEKESPDRHKSSHSSKSSHSNHSHKKESSSSKKDSSSDKDRHSHQKSSSKDVTRQSSESSSRSNSHKHKSSHEKENSLDKKHKYDTSSDEKKESKSSSKHSSEKYKSSSHKHESSSDKQKSTDKYSSKDRKSSSHSDNKPEKHKSSSEKDIPKHKSKEISSSSKDKHSSSKEEKSKEKEKSSSSKEKSSRSHNSSSNEKRHLSSDSKSHNSDKSKHKSDDASREKKPKEKSSSSSSHRSKSSSSSKSKEDVPKKKSKLSNSEDSGEDGIDCGSGASFAEALGMISPTKPKKKSSQMKDVNSPSNTFANDLSPATLLAPSAKLAPLPALEISALPEISPNYRPRPPPKPLPHFNDEDAISAGISSKNQRTKVYSGNKVIGKITSLYEMCVHVLQEHIDALEYTGGVPYEILKPVVDRATPQQLFLLEHYNPYLMEDTDHLWQKFCEKNFRNKRRQELESWREMFIRCQEEQESKLKSLTANIRLTQEAKKAPIKQTKMAYVDSIVKPPRNIARKQALHGTAHAATASPASRVSSLSNTPGLLKGGAPRPPPAAPVSSTAFNKPKKAPLMQKALQLMRGRKR